MSMQQCVERQRFLGIEAGRRLVEAQKLRTGAHCARDLEAPLRAIGQVAGRIVGTIDEIGLLQPVPGQARSIRPMPCGSR